MLSWLIGGRSEAASHILVAPAALWLLLFLCLPIASLLVLSVMRTGSYGTVVWSPTWRNFARALDPKYLPVLRRTFLYASATTLSCLALGFPLAYYLSFRAGKLRDLLMLGLVIPLWTSSLVAIYSWIVILGREGLLNSLLLRTGVIQAPWKILNTPFSVLLGLVYFYIPFMVLPLYSSLEKVPRSCLEAAADLGASPFETFWRVTWPLSLPGVAAGCVLTFIPCLGDFLTVEFLGSARTYLLGNMIQDQFLTAQDWPFGSALTAILLLFLVSALYFRERVWAEEEKA